MLTMLTMLAIPYYTLLCSCISKATHRLGSVNSVNVVRLLVQAHPTLTCLLAHLLAPSLTCCPARSLTCLLTACLLLAYCLLTACLRARLFAMQAVHYVHAYQP
jgi:hypothetical protein